MTTSDRDAHPSVWAALVEHLTDKTALTLYAALLALWAPAAVAESFFDGRVAEFAGSSHRLPDVRQLDEVTRAPFIRSYIRHRLAVDSRPGVLVLGDSQFFGFGCMEEDIFTAHLTRRLASAAPVINLSVVDARLGDVKLVLDAVVASDMRIAWIVWGLAPHHLGEEYRGGNLRRVPDEAWFRVSAFDLLRIDPKRGVSLGEPVFYVNPGFGRTMYSNLDVETPEFRGILNRLEQLRSRVLVVIPPVTLEEFDRYGYDRAAYEQLRRRIGQAAAQYGFAFLDATPQFSKTDFLDFMHLRPAGHAKLADLVEGYLR